jgi:hypothetical protein
MLRGASNRKACSLVGVVVELAVAIGSNDPGDRMES